MGRDVPATEDPCDICGKNVCVCFDFMGDVVGTNCLDILEEEKASLPTPDLSPLPGLVCPDCGGPAEKCLK